jgi:hypothetical protein
MNATTTRRVTAVVIATLAVSAGLGAADQSLADIARKEAERRGKTLATSKVYTNADLTPDFTTPAAPEPPPTATPAGAVPGGDGKAAAAPTTGGEAGAHAAEQEGVTPRDQQEPQRPSDKGEDFWHGRARMIQERLSAQRLQIETLRARLASFASGSADPEREHTAKALTQAVADLDSLNQEWQRFERQARERGVPGAWIR